MKYIWLFICIGFLVADVQLAPHAPTYFAFFSAVWGVALGLRLTTIIGDLGE